MSFYDTVARAKALLRENGRLSVAGLMHEFGLDDEAVERLVEELVDIQEVAVRKGKVLTWTDDAPAAADTAAPKPVPAAEAERRQLSVIFCDLVDSTRLADGMDPEDWREIVVSYYQAANGVIQRFGGHVAQYLGDGLLVYFGYPQAHEDDPERAVRAGLGIIGSLTDVNAKLKTRGGPVLSVRIGIHTGPVVMGGASDGERKETVALGDTMNLAARLQGQAEPNTVVMSAVTLRLVQGIFITRDLGSRELRGVAGQTAVHQAVRPSGMRSRFSAATGLTPLIGREQELGILDARFAQVTDGVGHTVLVGGEPGFGKSRLLQEFRERMAERRHTWLECRASPLTQDSAFFPVLELQRQGLGFAAEDVPELKTERIEAGLVRAGFDLARAMPLITSLHSLPLPARYTEPVLSPEGRRKQTLELLCEWLLRLSREQALVLTLEDLHWMDPSTIEFLGLMMPQLPTARLMILATHRPEFQSPWGRFSHVTPLQLSRLTHAQLAELVKAVARNRDVTDAWIDDVVRRSDGVPLFAEELARSALLSSANGNRAGPHIPETLQDSLTARLDTLGPVKEVVQLCAVLGREFNYDLLSAVSPLLGKALDDALTTAVRAEIFYQDGTLPNATFLFKHALLRDAAYDSMVRSTKRRHHRRIADAIVERMPQTAEAQPELVAYHFEGADSLEEAVRYYQKAGETAQRRLAHREAIEHLTKAGDLFMRLPDAEKRPGEEVRIRIALGNSAQAAEGHGGERFRVAVVRAVQLSRVLSDPNERAFAARGFATRQLAVGDLIGAEETVAEIKPMLRELDLTARTALLALGGVAAYLRGFFDLAISTLQVGISGNELTYSRQMIERGGQDDRAVILGWASCANWIAGRPDVAATCARQAVERSRATRHPYTMAYAMTLSGMSEEAMCGRNAAAPILREAAELSAQQAFPIWRFFSISMLSCLSPNADTIKQIEPGLASLRSAGVVVNFPFVLSQLASAKANLGVPKDALRLLQMARGISEQFNMNFWDAEIRRLEADIRLNLDPGDDVEPLLHEALAIARQQGARALELRAAMSLARMWQSRGKRDEARNLLAPVYGWFTEGFDTRDLIGAKALLDELSE